MAMYGVLATMWHGKRFQVAQQSGIKNPVLIEVKEQIEEEQLRT